MYFPGLALSGLREQRTNGSQWAGDDAAIVTRCGSAIGAIIALPARRRRRQCDDQDVFPFRAPLSDVIRSASSFAGRDCAAFASSTVILAA
jgi:hypothetical protein